MRNNVTPNIMMTTVMSRPAVPGSVMSPKPVVGHDEDKDRKVGDGKDHLFVPAEQATVVPQQSNDTTVLSSVNVRCARRNPRRRQQ